MAKKKQTGRPPKKRADRRVHHVGVYLTEKQFRQLVQMCEATGKSRSTFFADAAGLNKRGST